VAYLGGDSPRPRGLGLAIATTSAAASSSERVGPSRCYEIGEVGVCGMGSSKLTPQLGQVGGTSVQIAAAPGRLSKVPSVATALMSGLLQFGQFRRDRTKATTRTRSPLIVIKKYAARCSWSMYAPPVTFAKTAGRMASTTPTMKSAKFQS